MSADNWAICPRCNTDASKELDRRRAERDEGYGKVPRQEYARLVELAQETIVTEATLREDYEIGIYEDKTFFVSYHGQCTACGFHHSFKYEEKLDESQ